MRLALHPDGLAPRILNLGEWRSHLLHRLEREIALTGDEGAASCSKSCSAITARPPRRRPTRRAAETHGELRLAGNDCDLAFFSTVTTFGTAVDITVSELSIEAFFPADAQTAEVLKAEAVDAAAA